jgi:hypothetical protein
MPAQRDLTGTEPETVGPFVLRVEEDRLVIHESRSEYLVGCVVSLVAGPLFTLGSGALILSEIREPGGVGKEIVQEFLQLDPAGWPAKVLSIGVSWLAILLFALVSLVLLRALYRNVVYGRRPWIFDREQGFLLLGDKPVRPLLGIDRVSIERTRGRGGFVYHVSLMPESLRSATSGPFQGLRDDVFSFGNRKDAGAFAAAIAAFLDLGIVKDFD